MSFLKTMLSGVPPFRSRHARALGRAQGKRRYDLPLDKSAGAGFLTVLIGLMTFLAVLAMAASFALSAMTARWASGLENRITVEIPATDAAGGMRARADVAARAARVAETLAANADVQAAHVLTDDEIAELVRPWLGEDAGLGNIPLPGLIAVELRRAGEDVYAGLKADLSAVAPDARIDTHEAWLRDLLRFTRALQFAASLLTLVIGLTTAAAVAGAVRARMAVHHEQVELLHLMGARDRYISRQFQRHSLILALQGSIAGMVAGGLALTMIGWTAGEMDVNLLPDFTLDGLQIGAIFFLPLIVSGIAAATAAWTVRGVLMKMP